MNSEENKPSTIVQIIEKALSQFSSRLDGLESRLGKLEASLSVEHKILDERRIPAESGHLGGRILSSSPLGAVQRDIMVPFCDSCGKWVREEDLALCHSCQRKVCITKCLVKLGTDFLCIECLKTRLPLSKGHFKVLVAIEKEIERTSEIEKITKIAKDDVRAAISHLLVLDLIRKKGISIASRLEVTSEGLEAFGAYRSVYSADEDVSRFLDDLENQLTEEARS